MPRFARKRTGRRWARANFRRLEGARQKSEGQPGNHGIETPALGGDLVGLDAAPTVPGTVVGGEHRRQIRRTEMVAAWLRPAIADGPPAAASPGRAFARRDRIT